MILNIYLQNFRSYSTSKFTFNPGITLVYGNNGIGKTNLLEAVSLLAPGNGFRSANNQDLLRKTADSWNLSFTIEQYDTSYSINIHYINTKKIFINNLQVKSNELVDLAAVGWITPQIIFHFWRDSKLRRNLIDRLTNNIIPMHMHYCILYEKARAERSKLIFNRSSDDKAYKVTEQIMSENGLKIIQNRNQVVNILNRSILGLTENDGHCIKINNHSTPTNHNEFCIALARTRSINDRVPIGPHRSSIVLKYNNIIDHNSTGQQIMSIIHLSIAAFMTYSQHIKILLLDDIFSHLDSDNINKLFKFIKYIGPTYTIITNTNELGFIEQNLKL